LSQKLYNNCDMRTELRELVLGRIREEGLESFSCFDFTDFAPYKTISKCLERLEDDREITRIISGVYCLSRYDMSLDVQIYPSIDNVVHTIARKNSWIICPTGNTALNMMGLSEQVEAMYVYLTSGPYREYEIYGNTVRLKRTMSREIAGYSDKTNLLIQCLKEIGKDNVDESLLDLLRRGLTKSEKKVALEETTRIQTWIRNFIVTICEESL